MGFFEISKSAYLSHVIYMVKCVIGVAICYIFYAEIPQYPFYWAIVSVALATSANSNNNQAYDRIKATILGCAVGICLYPIHLPELLILCIGIAMIIILGVALKITGTLKSAFATLIIVMLQVEQTRHWYIALERVMCVVTGCIVALLFTLIFNLLIPEKYKSKLAAKD